MLNHEQIKKYLEIITKSWSFIDKYNWEGMNYSSKRYDWRMYEKNEITIAPYILCSKNEKVYIVLYFKT